jgi:hypothetical protein
MLYAPGNVFPEQERVYLPFLIFHFFASCEIKYWLAGIAFQFIRYFTNQTARSDKKQIN